MRLVLRLILMGIGLGVLTGSALKVLAPQVRNQQISLPEWISSQAWLSGLTPDEDEPHLQSPSQPRWCGTAFGRFEPKRNHSLSEKWKRWRLSRRISRPAPTC